jgi:protein disulfide-isomerase
VRLAITLVMAVAVLAVAQATAAPPPSEPPRPLLVPLSPSGPPAPASSPGQTSPQFKVPVVRIDWRTDLAVALAEAAKTGRPVLIYFHADWCQPCRLMDGTTFVNRAVAAYIGQHFIPVKVDDTKDTSPVSKKYDVRIYPSLLLLSAAAEPLHMVLFPRTAAELYPILEKMTALAVAIEAQKRAPEDLEANFRLGEAWAGLDHFRRAEPHLARVVQRDPRNERGRLVQARLMLAVVPLEDGDSAQAIKNLRQFIEEFKDLPQAPTALYAIGAILMQDGKLQEARRVFEDVRTRFRKDAKAYEADKAIETIDARLKAGAGENKKPAS